MKVDLAKLREIEEEGYLRCAKHPGDDLLIWNYTERCQFERKWTEETTMCRGLITDLEGNVVKRPFRKFFNIGEGDAVIPNAPFDVYEKMDGSLGILYWFEGQPAVATRGSFASEQAQWATDFINEHLDERDIAFLKKHDDKTFLVEIIYPENRIVVDYGDTRELVGLAVIDTESGKDVDEWQKLFGVIRIPCAKKYHFSDIAPEDLKSKTRDNSEGYVLVYPDGTRLKVKFDDYVRLHRIMTGVNERRVWDVLRAGQPLDEFLVGVPEEFADWITGVVHGLRHKYDVIHSIASYNVVIARSYNTRKEQAEHLKTTEYPSVAFAMLDGKDPSDHIWRMIKPPATKPFKVEV